MVYYVVDGFEVWFVEVDYGDISQIVFFDYFSVEFQCFCFVLCGYFEDCFGVCYGGIEVVNFVEQGCEFYFFKYVEVVVVCIFICVKVDVDVSVQEFFEGYDIVCEFYVVFGVVGNCNVVFC